MLECSALPSNMAQTRDKEKAVGAGPSVIKPPIELKLRRLWTRAQREHMPRTASAGTLRPL